MAHSLERHIYTSKGRSFQTVAESPGLLRQWRAELETQARGFMEVGDVTDPALVYRAFRLSSADTFAISLSMSIPGGYKASGNYIAHSYVIPRGLLEEVGYNLAWITAQLPFSNDFEVAAHTQLVPPLDYATDHQQECLLPLILEEVGSDGLALLLETLVGAPSSEVLALEMPPPHPRLGELVDRFLSGPSRKPPPTPTPDILRLWRLSALATFLPRAYRERFGNFSINQVSHGEADLWIPRTATSRLSGPSARPWTRRCIELASAGDLEALEEMRRWLSSFLVAASSSALDWGFDCHQNLVASAHPPTLGLVLDTLAAWKHAGHDVREEVAVESLHGALRSQNGLACLPRENRDLLRAMAEVASGRRLAPDSLLDDVAEELQRRDPGGEDWRVSFLRGLPPSFARQLWTHAERRRSLPAVVGHPRDDRTRGDLSFSLQVFDPEGWRLSSGEVSSAAGRFVDLLCEVNPPKDLERNIDAARLQLRRTLSGLDTLLRLLDRGLQAKLLEALAEGFAGRLESISEEQLLPLFDNHLCVHRTNAEQIARFLAALVYAAPLSADGKQRLLCLLMERASRWRDRLQKFMCALEGRLQNQLPLLDSVGVLREFLRTLDWDFDTAPIGRRAVIRLPRYDRWWSQRITRRGFFFRRETTGPFLAEAYGRFNRQLETTLAGQSAAHLLAVGSAYLQVNREPDFAAFLLRALKRRLPELADCLLKGDLVDRERNRYWFADFLEIIVLEARKHSSVEGLAEDLLTGLLQSQSGWDSIRLTDILEGTQLKDWRFFRKLAGELRDRRKGWPDGSRFP